MAHHLPTDEQVLYQLYYNHLSSKPPAPLPTSPEVWKSIFNPQVPNPSLPAIAPPGIPSSHPQGMPSAPPFAAPGSSHHPWQGPAGQLFYDPRASPSHIPPGQSSHLPQGGSAAIPKGPPSNVPQDPRPSEPNRANRSADPPVARPQYQGPRPQFKDLSRLQQVAQREILMPRRVREDGSNATGPTMAALRNACARQSFQVHSFPGVSTLLERPHFVIHECPNCHWRPEDSLPSSDGSRTDSSSSDESSKRAQSPDRKRSRSRGKHPAFDQNRQRHSSVTSGETEDGSPPWGPTNIETRPPSQPMPSPLPLRPPPHGQFTVPYHRLAHGIPPIDHKTGEQRQPDPMPPVDWLQISSLSLQPPVPYHAHPGSSAPQSQGHLWHPVPLCRPPMPGVLAEGTGNVGDVPYNPHFPGYQTWPYYQPVHPPSSGQQGPLEQTVPQISYSLSEDGHSHGSGAGADCSASPSPSPALSSDGETQDTCAGRSASGGRQLSKTLCEDRSRSMSPNRSGAILPLVPARKRSVSFQSVLPAVRVGSTPQDVSDAFRDTGRTTPSSGYHTTEQDIEMDALPYDVPAARPRSALLEVPCEQDNSAKVLRKSV